MSEYPVCGLPALTEFIYRTQEHPFSGLCPSPIHNLNVAHSFPLPARAGSR